MQTWRCIKISTHYSNLNIHFHILQISYPTTLFFLPLKKALRYHF